jgi:hypothetical protein
MTRPPIETMLNSITWVPVENATPTADGIPYATHSGVLKVAGMTLRVYQLDDGTRVIEQSDLRAFFAAMAGDDPRFTAAQNEFLGLFYQ